MESKVLFDACSPREKSRYRVIQGDRWEPDVFRMASTLTVKGAVSVVTDLWTIEHPIYDAMLMTHLCRKAGLLLPERLSGYYRAVTFSWATWNRFKPQHDFQLGS